MTVEEAEEDGSSEEEMLGRTQRMQTGKQIKTNDVADTSTNMSNVAAPKRSVPAFLKATTGLNKTDTSIISESRESEAPKPAAGPVLSSAKIF